MEPVEVAASRTKKTIVIDTIKDRDSKRHGVTYEGMTFKHTRATIVLGESITLEHVVQPGERYVRDPATGKHVPNAEAYTVVKTFKIGDWAEVHSYNLVYTGRVRKITDKTITCVEYEDSTQPRTYRMSLYDFAYKNWDFDVDAAAKRNADWRD
jgi:hypothetical protein